MLEIARCPACGQLAAGMSEWPVDQPVRCPYCRAEFVFGGTIEQPLRDLIPITAGEDECVAMADDTPGAPPSGPPAEPPDAEPATSAVPDESPSEIPAESTSEPQAGRFVVGQPVPLPPAYAGAYDFLPEEKKRQLETAGAVAARLRGDTRRRGCLGELIKMVLGAVLGLAIGYWLLNYFGGARFDWLRVYLPGCPHTQDHWPAEYLRPTPAEPPSPGPPEKPVPSPPPTESVPSQPIPESPDAAPTADPAEPAPSAQPDEPPESTTPTLQEDTTDLPTLPGLDKLRKSEE